MTRFPHACPTAVASALLLLCVPLSAADAGWSTPQAIRSPLRSAQPPSNLSVALGTGSRGTILAQRTTPEGAQIVAQGSVRRARVGRLADVLAGETLASAPSPAGAAAVVIRGTAGITGYVRDPRAPFAAPLALGPGSVQARVAVNSRGDAVFATAGTGPGAQVVALVIRPARGAPSAPIVVSDGGAITLQDVAIGARGHVAVTWNRGGVLEARTLDPTGVLSPIARLTAPGTQVAEAQIAVDGAGVTDLAAVVPAPAPPGSFAAAVVAARRPPGGVFSGLAVLDSGPAIESLDAVAAGRHGLVTWLRSAPGPAPDFEPHTRIHAASRRGAGALRRVTVQSARGGVATVSAPRPALAPDGGAVIVSGFGGSVHVARRAAGRSIFPRPRVISTLAGGTPASAGQNATAAAASGQRALVTWNDRDGLARASVLLPGTRDHSDRERSRPPRLRSTPPLLDLSTRPATIRAVVSCNRPCRVRVIVRVTGSNAVTVRAQRVLASGRRATIAQPISRSLDRRLRIGRIRSVRTIVTAANRYGALVRRTRVVP